MPENVYRAALLRARRVRYSAGQAMHARGDEGARIGIVAHGAVRVGRFQDGGSFSLLSTLGPGSHFGDVGLYRKAFTQSVYAIDDCEIDVIDAASLEDLLEVQPGFATGLWRCAMARLNAVLELYDDARTLPVIVRLAKVIYVHYGRGDIPNGVACLQRDLAELLSVSEVSIGNALKELERSGLVETGYRFIKVLDKERLRAWLRKVGAS
jgi:CRP/FNR family transcriptional regulator